MILLQNYKKFSFWVFLRPALDKVVSCFASSNKFDLGFFDLSSVVMILFKTLTEFATSANSCIDHNLHIGRQVLKNLSQVLDFHKHLILLAFGYFYNHFKAISLNIPLDQVESKQKGQSFNYNLYLMAIFRVSSLWFLGSKRIKDHLGKSKEIQWQ